MTKEKASGRSSGKCGQDKTKSRVKSSSSTSSKKSSKSSGKKSTKPKSYKSLKKSIKMPMAHSSQSPCKVASAEKFNKPRETAQDTAVAVKGSIGSSDNARNVSSKIEKKTNSTLGLKSSELTNKKSLSSKISQSFRGSGPKSDSGKPKGKTSIGKDFTNDNGSVFASSVKTGMVLGLTFSLITC